jgi:hypothetical protein
MGNTKVNPQANWFYAPANQMDIYKQQMMSQLQYTQQEQMFYSQFYANYGQFPQQFYYNQSSLPTIQQYMTVNK